MFTRRNIYRTESSGISILRGRSLEAHFDRDVLVIRQVSSCGILWWKRSNSLKIRLKPNKSCGNSIFDTYVSNSSICISSGFVQMC